MCEFPRNLPERSNHEDLSIVLPGIVLIWATGLAACGYRDLKRDMDAYAPPAMIQQAQASVPPVTSESDAFEAETANHRKVAGRWEKVVDETAGGSLGGLISNRR
jgi:hypothetical protein